MMTRKRRSHTQWSENLPQKKGRHSLNSVQLDKENVSHVSHVNELSDGLLRMLSCLREHQAMVLLLWTQCGGEKFYDYLMLIINQSYDLCPALQPDRLDSWTCISKDSTGDRLLGQSKDIVVTASSQQASWKSLMLLTHYLQPIDYCSFTNPLSLIFSINTMDTIYIRHSQHRVHPTIAFWTSLLCTTAGQWGHLTAQHHTLSHHVIMVSFCWGLPYILEAFPCQFELSGILWIHANKVYHLEYKGCHRRLQGAEYNHWMITEVNPYSQPSNTCTSFSNLFKTFYLLGTIVQRLSQVFTRWKIQPLNYYRGLPL